MPHPTRICVLGPVRAWAGGLEIDLGSPQQRATFALLLLSEGEVSIETLVDGIWGASPPRTAVSTARTYVYRLRTALRSAGVSIRSVGGGYSLSVPDEAVDVRIFRRDVVAARTLLANGDEPAATDRLSAAIGLGAGTPLMGVPGPFAESQRTSLLQARLTAHEELLALTIERGEGADAALTLAGLVEENPLRERIRGLHMWALYRSGRQADAITSYHDARRRLADELGVDPGPALQGMYRRILDADPMLQVRAPALAAPTPAGSAAVPAQLPAPALDFTGRNGLLATLTELIRPGAVIGVTGMAGAGKTALAVQAAHAARDRFPDGQLYVSLADDDGKPVPAGDALTFLLHSVGVPASAVPTETAQRAALWRSTVAGRRLLVVIDDAVAGDAVTELIPAAPGSATVVTSQRRLAEVPVTCWEDVGAMEPDDAVALIRTTAASAADVVDPTALARIAAACSYLPIALRMVGARLAARAHWDRHALAQYVWDCSAAWVSSGEAERGATARIQRSYLRLPETTAHALRVVGAADLTDITVGEVAGPLNVTEHAAAYELEELVQLHLVEAVTCGRYRLPPVVRQFLRASAGSVMAEYPGGRSDGSNSCRTMIVSM
ncbi:AfsR/SARP family transcriptional regulator [Catellatospora citrea]|uniref:DNA-binding SARP family transcriptional activator n=1 Tax=Catellatospora citrea TaxID=53366 RepID=A0A8J3KHN8_9ACTN|nr:BTAD domain-containing putative transcriptional regulator [Catellatospora citrea]RKE10604.1 DNA-binding SARP family transcriptional activator [Catellatospora citrea]GIG03128.1 hypothetical protein Cci01nite_82210 [Catellatospora citrea]